MKYLLTKKQMQDVDQKAIRHYGIPSLLLMEHAALSVFWQLKDRDALRLLILCGRGNNGGDGLALARQLFLQGKHKVKVILMTDSTKLSEDAQAYYKMTQRLNIPCSTYEGEGINRELSEYDLIVDALFGTGLSKPIEGVYREVIESVNKSGKEVLSIDIPSGVCADTGQILGVAIKAQTTITFAALKRGLCLYPGKDLAGDMICTEIGIPKQLIEEAGSQVFEVTYEDLKEALPKRPMRSHKGTYGTLVVIGGQEGMSGAPLLAAESALRVGSGLVKLAVPKTICDIAEIKLTEAITIPIEEGDVKKIKEVLRGASAVLIGPGLGRGKSQNTLLECVLESHCPCIIDADGIYALKTFIHKVKERQSPVIITPHPKELGVLIERPVEQILENPLEITQEVARQYGLIVVCKIEKSIISDGEMTWINPTGNPSLAKGGTGDVLAGIISGLLTQGLSPSLSAALGTYIHGKAADLWVERQSEYSLLASDLVSVIGKVL